MRHVLDQPPDLPDERAGAAVSEGWGRRPATIEHRPVGFGSHHWSIVDTTGIRWFLTIDDLDDKVGSAADDRASARVRLRHALGAARAARDHGATFVVAPERTARGQVVHEVTDRYVAALYPHVDGRSGPWDEVRSDEERDAVLALLVQVHTLPAAVGAGADPEELAVPRRDELEVALDDLDRPWTTGPHGEATRMLLARHADGIVRMLAHHDGLAARARSRTERAVLTHGEPHAGNTIRTHDGLALVDWDTARRAQPERDLWMLGDGRACHAYERATGRAVLADMLDLYRLSWDLTDIACFVDRFRAPHGDSADDQVARAALETLLAPDRRWPRRSP